MKGGPDNRGTVVEIAKKLKKPPLQNIGCMAYDINESEPRRNTLMICETWKDHEALKAHEQSEHFTSLVPRLEEMSNMKLEKFEF